ncbi:MAG: leucine-rich repeat domain-containing protein [Oscillospiraceae bacterium]|nr:leucine-rich repeat domain-containing protein [Oscillospiraceae bacterium]MCL2159281.1 leucine-rich repeat domain-containing protein [Oscillospiraceae bacterium]
MNEKYLLDAISDETLVRLIDETLTLEKNAKNKSIKKSLLKLIPAVAAIAIVIGLINQRGVVDMQSGTQSELVEGAIETETTVSEEIEKIVEFGETSDYIVINGRRIEIAETSLELDSSELTDADIEPLQYMVNLQSLRIISMTLQPGETYYKSGNISDIGPLAKLTNLVFLDLHGNQIDDISALANLTNLTNLDLLDNQIGDISALESLTNLTNLSLAATQIDDISALKNLTNLTWLQLRDNQIDDISILENLTNLTGLDLANNQISDISPLANLTNLTFLSLGNDALGKNQIGDISALENLTNLTNLALTHNQISDITPLANLTNLTFLDLRYNAIYSEQIEALREMLPGAEIWADESDHVKDPIAAGDIGDIYTFMANDSFIDGPQLEDYIVYVQKIDDSVPYIKSGGDYSGNIPRNWNEWHNLSAESQAKLISKLDWDKAERMILSSQELTVDENGMITYSYTFNRRQGTTHTLYASVPYDGLFDGNGAQSKIISREMTGSDKNLIVYGVQVSMDKKGKMIGSIVTIMSSAYPESGFMPSTWEEYRNMDEYEQWDLRFSLDWDRAAPVEGSFKEVSLDKNGYLNYSWRVYDENGVIAEGGDNKTSFYQLFMDIKIAQSNTSGFSIGSDENGNIKFYTTRFSMDENGKITAVTLEMTYPNIALKQLF